MEWFIVIIIAAVIVIAFARRKEKDAVAKKVDLDAAEYVAQREGEASRDAATQEALRRADEIRKRG